MNDKMKFNIQAGQLWKYKCRSSDKNSTVIILLIDQKNNDTIYHIAVNNVLINDEQTDIGHIPISREAIENSLTELVGNKIRLPEFKEAYDQWLDSDGGIWDISLKEVIDFTEKTIIESP